MCSISCCAITFIVIVIAFGISSMVLYHNSKKFVTRNAFQCKELPTNSNFVVDKVLTEQWQWSYYDSDHNIYVKQKCPTRPRQHDAQIFYGQEFVGEIQGKFKNTETKMSTLVKECHGNVVYTLFTGMSFDSYKQTVSFEMYNGTDVNEENLVAYAMPFNFFSDNVILYDYPSGRKIAELEYDVYNVPWNWNIQVTDNTHPAGNTLFLFAIAGKLAFSRGTGTDVCNNYFWSVSWSVLACSGIVLLVILYFGSRCCYKKMRDYVSVGRNKFSDSIDIEAETPYYRL